MQIGKLLHGIFLSRCYAVIGLVMMVIASFLSAPTAYAATAHLNNIPVVQNQPVTALWSANNSNHLDVFVTDQDGRVMSTWWEPSKSWQPWFAISPTSVVAAGPVTALWNASNSNHLDLFTVSQDGRVMSTWWELGKGWQPWFPISPDSLSDVSSFQTVTAMWAPYNSNHLDLFTVGQDGRVMSTWWEPGKSWQPWFPISPDSIDATSRVTALWSPTNSNHLDLFTVNSSGYVASTWWEPGKSWQGWFLIDPTTYYTSAIQVTALWSPTNPYHLDLFTTDRYGRAIHNWWQPDSGWQLWSDFQDDINIPVTGDHAITAAWASYNNNHLDLFMLNQNGQVASTWREQGKNWQSWFPISPDTLVTTAQITALWNVNNAYHLDLFTVSQSGTVMSIWWDINQGWQGWFAIGS